MIKAKRINKNESVSVGQYVQTLKQTHSFQYGSLNILFNSHNEEELLVHSNVFVVDLQRVAVDFKNVVVDVECPEVT